MPFIDKSKRSAAQHTQQQAVQIAVSVADVVAVAAVSAKHLCGAHWHVAHVCGAEPNKASVLHSPLHVVVLHMVKKSTDDVPQRGEKVCRGRRELY